MEPGLSDELIESLAGYCKAPYLERRCLFVIAARTDPSELQQYRLAFSVFDKDGDGRVSRMDLINGLRAATCLSTAQVDADRLFSAADLDCAGMINFTKFASACLHKSLAPLDGWLAQQTFESLDRDNDGLLNAQQVQPLFGELPAGLPRKQSFGLKEWSGCLLASVGIKGNSTEAFRELFGIFDGCGSSPKGKAIIDLHSNCVSDCSVDNDNIEARQMVLLRLEEGMFHL